MKTQEQNTKEVMTYLEKSSKHFFESGDGNHWQSIVYLHAHGRYVFIKDGEVNELNMKAYTGKDSLGNSITEGKTLLKYLVHPHWDIPTGSSWFKGYGHGPKKKLRAVRWTKARLELTSTAAQEYLSKLETSEQTSV
jgi:hypothetical protein